MHRSQDREIEKIDKWREIGGYRQIRRLWRCVINDASLLSSTSGSSVSREYYRSLPHERIRFGWTTWNVLETRQTLLCVHTTGGVCITVIMARTSTYSASCPVFPSLFRVRHTQIRCTDSLT